MILNGATSIWADHLTLALPAFAAARLLTGGADSRSLTYIAFFLTFIEDGLLKRVKVLFLPYASC